MVREIMQFHARDKEAPQERVRQAVAVCQFIAGSSAPPDTYRQFFMEQLQRIQRSGTATLFHDDLAEINDPFYFHQFMSQAAHHDLQYLGEADFFEMQDLAFSDEARQILKRMEDSRLTREQYLDFVKLRRFRQTLLCHREAPVCYPENPEAIQRFHISSQASSAVTGKSIDGLPYVRFTVPSGGTMEFGLPLGIRALRLLSERWPATWSFDELWAAATAGTESAESLTDARQQLAEVLLEAYRVGLLDFRRTPLRCASKPSARPAAWAFARWQLGHSPLVTTLHGENLRLEDEPERAMVQRLDGTMTLAELCQRFPVANGASKSTDDQIKNLRKRLEDLARLGLLEA
jgi:hypothetical protein